MKNKSLTYLLRISGPFMTIQCAPVSFATALAINVFPVPGGPCKITPRGAETPESDKADYQTKLVWLF